MGRTAKRSDFPSDGRASYLPRKATLRKRHWGRRENANRNSRMRNGRKITTSIHPANTNIHPIRRRIASVVVRPRNLIEERYESRNVCGSFSSRKRNARYNTPAIADNSNSHEVRRRIPSKEVQTLNPIVVRIEHGIRFSRFRSAKSDATSALTHDLHIRSLPSISSTMENRFQREAPERYAHRNEECVSKGRHPTKDTPMTTENDTSTMQALGTSASVVCQPLKEIAEKNILLNKHGFNDSTMRNVRNCRPTGIAEDLNCHQAPSACPYIETRLHSETEDRSESCTEFGIRFSRLRNERCDSPVSITRNPNIQLIQNIHTSTQSRPLSQTVEEYERWLEFEVQFSGLRTERDVTSVPIAQNPNTQQVPSLSTIIESQPLSETMDGYECSICLDTRHWRKMRHLRCLHKFHKKCINKWLKENDICPICRLSTEDVGDIARHLLQHLRRYENLFR